MDGRRRLGSMDLDMVDVDLSVNVVSAVSPPIVESLMKTRMETFETRLVIFIIFVVVGVITISVAITIAVADAVIIVVLVLVVIVILVIGISSIMILSKR